MKDFELDKDSKRKLYYQLFREISGQIENNTLKTGTKLPSVRVMSQKQGISKNTVTKAYEELEKAGYITSVPKSGFFVKKPGETLELNSINTNQEDQIPTVESIMDAAAESKKDTFVMADPFDSEEDTRNEPTVPKQSESAPIILSSGQVIQSSAELNSELNKTSLSTPEQELSELYRQAFIKNKQHKVNKEDSLIGDETLRIAVAAFLYNFRKTDVNPANIIIGTDIKQLIFNILSLPFLSENGIKSQGHGLLQLAELSSGNGHPNVNPSIAICEGTERTMKKILSLTGKPVKEIPQDDSGMNFDFLVTSGATMVFTTPTDVPPSDSPLKDLDSRRNEILSWVTAEPYRYIIEYDTSTCSEDATPFLHENSDKVIYTNSFETSTFGTIKAAFAVLPKKLAEEYKSRYEGFECPLSSLNQTVISDILLSGKLQKYLDEIEQL